MQLWQLRSCWSCAAVGTVQLWQLGSIGKWAAVATGELGSCAAGQLDRWAAAQLDSRASSAAAWLRSWTAAQLRSWAAGQPRSWLASWQAVRLDSRGVSTRYRNYIRYRILFQVIAKCTDGAASARAASALDGSWRRKRFVCEMYSQATGGATRLRIRRLSQRIATQAAAADFVQLWREPCEQKKSYAFHIA